MQEGALAQIVEFDRRKFVETLMTLGIGGRIEQRSVIGRLMAGI